MPTKQKVIMEVLQVQVKPKSLVLLSYFKIVFNFGYAICLIPYRLKHNGAKSKLHVNRFHQVICAIVHLLIMYEYMSMIRFIDWNNLGGDAFNSLHAVASFASITYGFTFSYTVWMKRDDMLKAARLIENLEFFDTTDKWVGLKVNLLAVGICFWYTAFSMTDTTLHDNSLVNGNVSGFFSQLYTDSKAVYLFERADDASSTFTKIAGVLFTVIHIVIAIPRFLLIQLVELTVLATCFCLWHIMRDFLKFKDVRSNYPNSDEIFSNYAKLKDLVKVTNNAIGILTFSCIGVSLPFYASWTAIIFFHDNVEWRHLIHFYFYFGSFFLLLTVAADFHSKCGEFYSWVSIPDNSDGISSNRMTSLVMDMLSNQIALRGSGIFIMTYRFFGTILSVILTYTIIIIQFQVSKRGYGSGMKSNPDLDDFSVSPTEAITNSSLILA